MKMRNSDQMNSLFGKVISAVKKLKITAEVKREIVGKILFIIVKDGKNRLIFSSDTHGHLSFDQIKKEIMKNLNLK